MYSWAVVLEPLIYKAEFACNAEALTADLAIKPLLAATLIPGLALYCVKHKYQLVLLGFSMPFALKRILTFSAEIIFSAKAIELSRGLLRYLSCSSSLNRLMLSIQGRASLIRSSHVPL